jgi:flagellum-specific peptidoglycan hydrolase FlgJ
MIMKQLKKQTRGKDKTTSNPQQDLLAFNGFKRIKKFFQKVIILIALFYISIVIGSFAESPLVAMDNEEETEHVVYVNSIKERVNTKLIEEVKNYLQIAAPGTKIDPEMLVNLCDKYKMDVSFVIAQGLLESHMGTKGLAAQTNSVWNVGTYDDGQIKHRYSDPNESIEPYLKLVTEKYLIKITSSGDTIKKDIIQLTRDRGFVNYRGYRYATSPTYESSLRKYILEINMKTEIATYQGIMELDDQQILDFFSPYKIQTDSVLLASNL